MHCLRSVTFLIFENRLVLILCIKILLFKDALQSDCSWPVANVSTTTDSSSEDWFCKYCFGWFSVKLSLMWMGHIQRAWTLRLRFSVLIGLVTNRIRRVVSITWHDWFIHNSTCRLPWDSECRQRRLGSQPSVNSLGGMDTSDVISAADAMGMLVLHTSATVSERRSFHPMYNAGNY